MAKQYGILVDIGLCIGCGVCVTACKQENHLPPDADDVPGTTGTCWNQVLAIAEGRYPDLREYHIPVHCMHCENPPCLPACPHEAISKSTDGIVVIHESKCNACDDQPGQRKKCMVACPYGAIQFSEKKGVAQSCTLCIQRVAKNVEPACVRACIGRCLTFGDFNDPNSEISQKVKEAGDRLFVFNGDKGTNPSLKYINPEHPWEVQLDRISPLTTRVTPIYGYGSNYNKPAE